MKEETSKHIPVLLHEVLEYMELEGREKVVDGTVNGGGHAVEILKRLKKDAFFLGIDLDENALHLSSKRFSFELQEIPKFCLVRGNFKDVEEIIKNCGLHTIDRFFLDLGWSSNQFEDSSRGFSFRKEGPLKMFLSSNEKEYSFSAWDIVNTWDEEHLITIFSTYGEETFSKRIARAIVERRKEKTFDTTLELADFIKQIIPVFHRKKNFHPATRIFQALRITVNNEIENLSQGLESSFRVLSKNGRILVISFHSLEDRIVKKFMKEKEREGEAKILTKKAVKASEEEKKRNRRSRSAKLRVLVKV